MRHRRHPWSTCSRAPGSAPCQRPSLRYPAPFRRWPPPPRLDALLRRGQQRGTTSSSSPQVPSPEAAASAPDLHELQEPEEWLSQERALLVGVLVGQDDQSPRWGLFRRRIGLRYDEPVPERLWSTADLKLVALEVDAIFRGQRDVHAINAEAIRQDARARLAWSPTTAAAPTGSPRRCMAATTWRAGAG
jgi:hypothetical protein